MNQTTEKMAVEVHSATRPHPTKWAPSTYALDVTIGGSNYLAGLTYKMRAGRSASWVARDPRGDLIVSLAADAPTRWEAMLRVEEHIEQRLGAGVRPAEAIYAGTPAPDEAAETQRRDEHYDTEVGPFRAELITALDDIEDAAKTARARLNHLASDAVFDVEVVEGRVGERMRFALDQIDVALAALRYLAPEDVR